MKTYLVKTLAVPVIALSVGLLPFSAGANEQTESSDSSQLIYQSKSVNQNIYSYASKIPGASSLKPELIYVSQANGPAIYSYVHSGDEKTVPWNVEYVDTAYGQAIYSYERPRVKGVMELVSASADN